MVEFASQGAELVVEQFDDVEVIEDVDDVGEVVLDGSDEGLPLSVATASILARDARSRFHNGTNASTPLPSPTNTTAP